MPHNSGRGFNFYTDVSIIIKPGRRQAGQTRKKTSRANQEEDKPGKPGRRQAGANQEEDKPGSEAYKMSITGCGRSSSGCGSPLVICQLLLFGNIKQSVVVAKVTQVVQFLQYFTHT